MKKVRLLLLGLLGASFASLVQAYMVNLVIDDFSTFQEEIVNKKASVTGSTTCTSFGPSSDCAITHTPGPGIQVSGGGILGGYRDLYVSTGPVSGFGTKGTTATTGSVLDISNDSGVAGTVIVVWDGSHPVTADPSDAANINTTGLGGVDFTLSPGSFGILLDVLSIDLSVTAALTLWDMGSHTATASYTFSSASDHVFTFADFLSANALLDLDHIGAVRLTLTGPAGWDGQIDLIGVVTTPEPTALALFGVGLLGLGVLTKRQNSLPL